MHFNAFNLVTLFYIYKAFTEYVCHFTAVR